MTVKILHVQFYGHLVLRGGRSGANYGAEAIADAQNLLSSSNVRSQLMVDCSHGNSNKDHTQQSVAFKDVVAQRVNGDDNIIGCMMESNLNPGAQKLNGDAATLDYGVSITDACIGWEETESLIRWAHAEVGAAKAEAPAD